MVLLIQTCEALFKCVTGHNLLLIIQEPSLLQSQSAEWGTISSSLKGLWSPIIGMIGYGLEMTVSV
jgi:hypothetical protein